MRILLFFIALQTCLFSQEKFITARVFEQLGNNLFQVAAACALAWDNGAIPYFPDLLHKPMDYAHVFFRLNIHPPSSGVSCVYEEPSLAYHPIPFQNRMHLDGYFQSEKYFSHHRERLLKLFAPSFRDLYYMQRKYEWLIQHPHTVGVQLRYYFEDPPGGTHNQYGKDYVEKAMAFFPGDTLFIVSSNDIAFAKRIVPQGANAYFIEDEPYYINLYLLSFCKHNIITNSTFGWWAAWLNQHPNKIVVAPKEWFVPSHPRPYHDIVPESWIKLAAKWGINGDPSSYY